MLQALVVLALAASTGAQTVAKQGEPPPKQFASPMVIETPLRVALLVAGIDPLPKDSGWVQADPQIREHVCENVSFLTLAMKLKQAKGGMGELELRVMLLNRRGQDKLVTLKFEIMNGGELPDAILPVLRLSAEEDKTTAFHTTNVILPRSAIIAHPTTTVRITMTVVDD